MRTVRLEIVTPERKVYSDDVTMVIARGGDGDLGILAGHAPLATTLKTAPLRIRKGEGQAAEQVIAVAGGFMEVTPDKITVLAEAAELPEEIDVDRAQRSKERAERRLADAGKEDLDFARAEKSLQRAINRIQTALSRR